MPVDCQSCLLLNNWSTGPQGNSLTSPSRSGLEISSSAKKMKPFTRYDQYLGIKGSHTNNTSAPELFRNSKVFLAWIPKAEHSLLALQRAGGAWSGAASPAGKRGRGGLLGGSTAVPMCWVSGGEKGEGFSTEMQQFLWGEMWQLFTSTKQFCTAVSERKWRILYLAKTTGGILGRQNLITQVGIWPGHQGSHLCSCKKCQGVFNSNKQSRFGVSVSPEWQCLQ